MSFNRKVQRQKRHLRLRQKVVGTAARPRMSICITNKNIYVQFIDDDAGKTLASASTIKGDSANLEAAKALGATAAEAAKAAGVSVVVVDRGGAGSRVALRLSLRLPSRQVSRSAKRMRRLSNHGFQS